MQNYKQSSVKVGGFKVQDVLFQWSFLGDTNIRVGTNATSLAFINGFYPGGGGFESNNLPNGKKGVQLIRLSHLVIILII